VDKITLISYPDYYHDQSKKALLINTTAEERSIVQQFLASNDMGISIYIYNNENQIEWLLNVANMVDTVYINVDNTTDRSYHYLSYLVSLTNTTWNSRQIDYSVINRGKAIEINEYIQKHWLA
jgi:hypothetical protein